MKDLKIDQRLYEATEIEFTIRADDPKKAYLVEDAILDYGGERYFITEVQQAREGAEADYRVKGEIAWMRLADVKKPGSYKWTDRTAEEGLVYITRLCNWTIAEVDQSVTTFSFEAQDSSVLDMIWQWAKITGLEVLFDSMNRQISMIPTIGANTGISFRYGRNMTAIRRYSSPPTTTRLYAYGRNNMNIKTLSGGYEYIEDYTFYTAQGYTLGEAQANFRKDEIWSNDSFVNVAGLYSAAQTRLSQLSQPMVRYEAKVVDFRRLIPGLNNYRFRLGDYVRVYDEILAINVLARISRIVDWPDEPGKNEVELSFNPVALPDPQSSNSRADTTKVWELFQNRNLTTTYQVRNYTTLIHRIQLETVEDAEWVIGFKLQGVTNGAMDLTLTFLDDETGDPFWPSSVDTLSNGQEVEYNFTFGQQEIPAGVTTLVVRALGSHATNALLIAVMETSLWVLARGTTRTNPTLTNSERFDFNGSTATGTGGTVQTFEVPEDITEIQIECHGAAGAPSASTGGAGGKVSAKFAVTPGQILDVYCGGGGTVGGGAGWPNGGIGTTSTANSPFGGGGSSHVVATGGAFASAWIVAAGGGGINRPGASRTGADCSGGYGGFYAGQAGYGLTPVQTRGVNYAGLGATQTAGGAAGTGGTAGAANAGGYPPAEPDTFDFQGGGGGGGWYGGGGAGDNVLFGGGTYAGDGGGGSGHLNGGFDLEIEDGENQGQGYIIISWDTPET